MGSGKCLEKIKKIRNHFTEMIEAGINTIAELSLDSKCYEVLKPYVKWVLKHPNTNCDIVFTYMLVQYTMREYNGTDFYPSFCAAMDGPAIDSTYIKEIIKGTISKYGLQDFGYFQAQRTYYVECVKAHSVAYYAKQEDFLDSSKKIYEWLGCNIQDKEIVKRALFFIQQKTRLMSSTIRGENDVELVFGDDRNGRRAPRLYLPVSSFRFFSSVSINTLMRVFYPILQLIDDWRYPDDEPNQIPKNKTSWIEHSYKEWVNVQNNKQDNIVERIQKSPYRNHTPSYRIDSNTERDTFKIVIPEITKEASGSTARWYCEIRSDGKNIIEPFELIISGEYSFGNAVFWKTSQVSKSLEWSFLFSDLSIIVYQVSSSDDTDEIIAEWKINKNTYRLFDINGYQIKKLQVNKENILLVSPDSSFEGKNISNIRRSRSISFEKIHFLASPDAAVKIDNSAIISVAGQYYSEPFFAEERDTIVVEKDGNRVIAAKRHPDISINCRRGEEKSICVKINGTPRRPLDKKYYKVTPDISDSEKIIVSFSIESFMISENIDGIESDTNDYLDGLYSVEYGVAGRTTKTISYFILQSLAFRFSRPRFYDSSCELEISKEHSLTPLESDVCSFNEFETSDDSYWKRYNITIKPQCEGICFNMKEYGVVLTIPVRKAIYFFSDIADAVFFRQQTSIPFAWIRNTMNIMISGAQKMVLECNGVECNGQLINQKDGHFRFDLSDISASFHNSLPSEIKVRYNDTKARETAVWVHSIKPLSPKKCFSEENNTVYYFLEDMPTGATCYIDIFANELGDSLIDSILLSINDRQKLIDLESNKSYWYRRRIVLPNIIPGLPCEFFYIDNKRCRLPFFKLDKDKLDGFMMDILDPKNRYNYKYSVQFVQKKPTFYRGYLFENNRRKGIIDIYDFVEDGNILKAKIAWFNQKEKRRYRLALHHYQLVGITDAPNDYLFTFDRNSFKKGEI